MRKSFWNNLDIPIVGLSPMDGVTDEPCRFIAKKYGKADVIYTEFVSVDGLWRINEKGEMDHRIWKELAFDESERPVIAQIFGSDPESFYKSAKIVANMGFDGIDINMGCPSPGLEKREGGAGLMRNKKRAKEVIEATRKGVHDAGKEIPISVKTRLGSSEPDPSWWQFLSEQGLPAVAMHGRTFKQLYSGEADWNRLKEAAQVIRGNGTLFLANGDIQGLKVNNENFGVILKNGQEIGISGWCDGVLVGRAAIGNPWVLRKDGHKPDEKELFEAMIEHSKRHEKLFGEKGFPSVRKHLAGYVKWMENASNLRKELVLADSSGKVEDILKKQA